MRNKVYVDQMLFLPTGRDIVGRELAQAGITRAGIVTGGKTLGGISRPGKPQPGKRPPGNRLIPGVHVKPYTYMNFKLRVVVTVHIALPSNVSGLRQTY